MVFSRLACSSCRLIGCSLVALVSSHAAVTSDGWTVILLPVWRTIAARVLATTTQTVPPSV